MGESDDTQAAVLLGQGEDLGQVVAGTWTLVKWLGSGGTATVYEAVNPQNQRVALKLLRPALSDEIMVCRRFEREARLANALSEHGAVSVYAAGRHRGRVYLAMEHLTGETLESYRKRAGGRLSIKEVTRLAEPLLSFLEAAHARGIVHRDIKPSNLFLKTSGELKVLDLGIAAFLASNRDDSLQTEQGAILGTPAFMPPEQARGRFAEVDARSDIWAAGATLFTLLTGQLVHQAGTSVEQLGCAMSLAAPRIRSIRRDVPLALARVIDKALAYDAQNRWQTAGEMRRALGSSGIVLVEEVGTTLTEITAPPSKRSRRQYRLRLAMAAFTLVPVGGLGWWALAPLLSPSLGVGQQVALSQSQSQSQLASTEYGKQQNHQLPATVADTSNASLRESLRGARLEQAMLGAGAKGQSPALAAPRPSSKRLASPIPPAKQGATEQAPMQLVPLLSPQEPALVENLPQPFEMGDDPLDRRR